MIFLVPILIAAIIVIIFFGGKLGNLLDCTFKYSWLVLVAVGIKILSISGLYSFLGLTESFNPYLRVISLSLVIIFVLVNISLRGVPIVGLGLMLNTLVISINGGNMPINESYAHMVFTPTELLTLKDGLPVDSFILSSSNTKLSFLGDVISIPWGGALLKLFSVGDIVITLGGIVFISYYLRHRIYA